MVAPTEAEPLRSMRAMEPRRYRVVQNRRNTTDTATLSLEAIDDAGTGARPGQFTMVYAFGVGEVPISVSGMRDGTIEHTVRDVGATTHAIASATPGTVLGIRGPLGVGWPLAEATDRDVVVVAGGLGMAPLRPAVTHVLGNRETFRDVTLLYGARSPEDILYRDELDRWRQGGRIAVELTVDSADPSWSGRVGLVPRLIADAQFDPATCIAIVCGPEVMMRFTALALLDAGVSPNRIYVSLERHMQCGIGLCGHCQLGPTLICRDGPVYRWSDVARWLAIREL